MTCYDCGGGAAAAAAAAAVVAVVFLSQAMSFGATSLSLCMCLV